MAFYIQLTQGSSILHESFNSGENGWGLLLNKTSLFSVNEK